jgi:Peptidase M61 N-terminal domain
LSGSTDLLMRRTVTLFILVFASFLLASAKAKPGPVQLRYRVDASQPAKRFLKIQATIEGLPEGRTTIVFPDSKNSLDNRISQVGWESEDGEVSAMTLEDGQLVVESSTSEPVKLVFQLRSESFQHLDFTTYLDEDRCLFHLQDVFLQIENQDPKVAVSFVLPDSWEVISTARPARDGSYLVETKRPTPFYLGKAESAHDADNDLLAMVIEPGWLPAKELLAALRPQIRHRQKFGKRVGSRPLLAVFLSSKRPVPSKEVLPSGVPQLLALNASLETPLAIRTLQQAMARGLARLYLPAVASFSATLGPDQLIDYLTLKALRKTGVLGKGEFLDALAVDLWSTFGEGDESQSRPRSNAKTARSAATLPPCTQCSGVLLDLALSFYGDTAQSLDAFLANGFAAEPITEADLRRRLRQEPQAAAALTGVWQHEETQRIGDLLRPFALLFDRQELPAFDFRLNETFQIAQLVGHTQGATILETGDRILAIDNHRLVLPDDLLKCRSRLTPGQEVQLDVERRSSPLRVTHRMAKEVMLKLEINKLADADKQQKLEQFLSVESEEN